MQRELTERNRLQIRGVLAAAVIVLLAASPGCHDQWGGLPPNPPIPVPLPTGPPVASLTIEDAWVSLRPASTPRTFWGEVRFLLRETSGESGATIREVLIPGGSDPAGPACWQGDLRVPPGGTLDRFYTDAGLSSLGYCAPWALVVDAATGSHPIVVSVTFYDDGGRLGKVEGTVTPK